MNILILDWNSYAQEYDFVFSFNFFPIAAKACNECNVKYVSWIYDMPYMLLYSKYTRLETNHIYFFDKALCIEFQKSGIKNALYAVGSSSGLL